MKLLFAIFSLGAVIAAEPTIYDLPLTTIDGTPANLGAYRGKTLLIVNTASKCGYTTQYEGLEKLYGKYKSRGLVVLGFPSNDFAGQEPGSNADIRKFCQTRFHVDFPMYAKAAVSGVHKQPLFQWLTTQMPGEVKWNFEKFLIDGQGHLVARFDSSVSPDAPALIAKLEKNLAP